MILPKGLEQASKAQLQQWDEALGEKFSQAKSQNLNLDLTRGKPSAEQLSLSNELDGILQGDYTADGVDTRNYGGLDGITEIHDLGSKLLDSPAANILAGGNSSLTLMHQCVLIGAYFGFRDEASAWHNDGPMKFICPVPGYDRHFSVCEHLGIEMLTVPMTPTGPDMDAVENLIKNDKSIKGMWCVPKYSNPTGVVYDEATVTRIAALGKIAHRDFRVFWDNAYAVHDLNANSPQIASIFAACAHQGTENSVLQFASTSKITFAGAGIAFLAGSANNLNAYKKYLRHMSIGPDKINQLRHVRFFQKYRLDEHMQKHAGIIQPRFATVLRHLEKAFGKNDLGTWESPEGGYFIAFDTRPGLAKKVVAMAAEAGVKLTPAGATFPYGKDPNDCNIRIAPTVPSVEQVDAAMAIFVLCVQLASVRQVLAS